MFAATQRAVPIRSGALPTGRREGAAQNAARVPPAAKVPRAGPPKEARDCTRP